MKEENRWITKFKNKGDYVEESFPWYSPFTYAWSTWTNNRTVEIQRYASTNERKANEVRKLDMLKGSGLAPEIVDYREGLSSILLNHFNCLNNGRWLISGYTEKEQKEVIRSGLESLLGIHEKGVVHGDAMWKNSYPIGSNYELAWYNFSTVIDESNLDIAKAYDLLTTLLSLKRDGNVGLMYWVAKNMKSIIGDGVVFDLMKDLLETIDFPGIWIGRRLTLDEFIKVKELLK